MADELSRRERQILDILYHRSSATAAEVQSGLPDSPSYSAVRALLRILEDKGHITHEEQGPRYVYRPRVPKEKASRSAMRHLLQTFFQGSVEQAVTALLDENSKQLSKEELDRIAARIEAAKQGEQR